MNQLQTKAIVLTRIDFGEADRIITLLTPDHGKLRLMAKGVRKIRSKLAGGIELFSSSDVTYIRGRGDIGTLVSARLDRHYGNIVQQIERVQLGYDSIKKINRATEDEPEPAYYYLLDETFRALNDMAIPTIIIGLWFQAQLLKLAGYMPNLSTDINHMPLRADENFDFDISHMAFSPSPEGAISVNHIKVLRLLFGNNQLSTLGRIDDLKNIVPAIAPLLFTMLNTSIRV